MSSPSSTNNNDPNEEGLVAHMIRVCKNSCTKCFGIVQTTDEYAKIKYKEHLIDTRKKQFGIEYLKLIHENASDAEKQACIDSVLNDTKNIEKEIDVLKQEIERVNQLTKEKLINKPGTTSAANTTTGTATTTAAATSTTTPETAATTTATAAPTPTTTTAPMDEPPMSSAGVEVSTTTTGTTMTTEMVDVPLTTTTTTNEPTTTTATETK